MKKISFRLFSLFVAGAVITSCNNNGSNTSASDSTNTTSTTTSTSSNNYSARADTIRMNSQAGNYLNARTGKQVNLRMDTRTGAITDDMGHPVKRYVDKRTWHVYDATSGDTIGSAQMNNGNLMYRGWNGDWVPYDKRWTDDTTSTVTSTPSDNDSGMNTSIESSGSSNGTSGRENRKVKIKEHGNKVKTVEKTKE